MQVLTNCCQSWKDKMRRIFILCMAAVFSACAWMPQNQEPAEESMHHNTYEPKYPTYKKLPPDQVGDMGYTVEKLAKARGCTLSESAALMSKRPGLQFYRAACADGSQILYKCELRQCAVAD